MSGIKLLDNIPRNIGWSGKTKLLAYDFKWNIDDKTKRRYKKRGGSRPKRRRRTRRKRKRKRRRRRTRRRRR